MASETAAAEFSYSAGVAAKLAETAGVKATADAASTTPAAAAAAAAPTAAAASVVGTAKNATVQIITELGW